jgi:3-deoxy-D-manno-octulosonic-acid transferase
MFEEAGGMRIVSGEEQLRQALNSLISSNDDRQQLSAKANAVLENNRGALGKVEALIVNTTS